MAFNPNEARDAHGRWSKVAAVGKLAAIVKGLKVGESEEIGAGSGLKVKAVTNKDGGKTVRKFEVSGSGAAGPRTPYSTAEDAAKAALVQSSQQQHPNALGGERKLSGISHAERHLNSDQKETLWDLRNDPAVGSLAQEVSDFAPFKQKSALKSIIFNAEDKGNKKRAQQARDLQKRLGWDTSSKKSSLGGPKTLEEADAEIARLKKKLYNDPGDAMAKMELRNMKRRRKAMKDSGVKPSSSGGAKKDSGIPANETKEEFQRRRRKERRLARKEKAAGGTSKVSKGAKADEKAKALANAPNGKTQQEQIRATEKNRVSGSKAPTDLNQLHLTGGSQGVHQVEAQKGRQLPYNVIEGKDGKWHLYKDDKKLGTFNSSQGALSEIKRLEGGGKQDLPAIGSQVSNTYGGKHLRMVKVLDHSTVEKEGLVKSLGKPDDPVVKVVAINASKNTHGEPYWVRPGDLSSGASKKTDTAALDELKKRRDLATKATNSDPTAHDRVAEHHAKIDAIHAQQPDPRKARLQDAIARAHEPKPKGAVTDHNQDVKGYKKQGHSGVRPGDRVMVAHAWNGKDQPGTVMTVHKNGVSNEEPGTTPTVEGDSVRVMLDNGIDFSSSSHEYGKQAITKIGSGESGGASSGDHSNPMEGKVRRVTRVKNENGTSSYAVGGRVTDKGSKVDYSHASHHRLDNNEQVTRYHKSEAAANKASFHGYGQRIATTKIHNVETHPKPSPESDKKNSAYWQDRHKAEDAAKGGGLAKLSDTAITDHMEKFLSKADDAYGKPGLWNMKEDTSKPGHANAPQPNWHKFTSEKERQDFLAHYDEAKKRGLIKGNDNDLWDASWIDYVAKDLRDGPQKKNGSQATTNKLQGGEHVSLPGATEHHGVAVGEGHEIYGGRRFEKVLLKVGDRTVASSYEHGDLKVHSGPDAKKAAAAKAYHDAHSQQREADRAAEILKDPSVHVEPPPHIPNETWEQMTPAQRISSMSDSDRQEMEAIRRSAEATVKAGRPDLPKNPLDTPTKSKSQPKDLGEPLSAEQVSFAKNDKHVRDRDIYTPDVRAKFAQINPKFAAAKPSELKNGTADHKAMSADTIKYLVEHDRERWERWRRSYQVLAEHAPDSKSRDLWSEYARLHEEALK